MFVAGVKLFFGLVAGFALLMIGVAILYGLASLLGTLAKYLGRDTQAAYNAARTSTPPQYDDRQPLPPPPHRTIPGPAEIAAAWSQRCGADPYLFSLGETIANGKATVEQWNEYWGLLARHSVVDGSKSGG